MSPREKRLRERIDRQSDRITALERRLNGNARRTTHCVYCGRKVRSRSLAPVCAPHRDLLTLDPYYA